MASGTPVKFWRTSIEPDGLRQGRPSESSELNKNRQGRLYYPCLSQTAINIFGGI